MLIERVQWLLQISDDCVCVMLIGRVQWLLQISDDCVCVVLTGRAEQWDPGPADGHGIRSG